MIIYLLSKDHPWHCSCVCVCVCSFVQSCLTLCDPMTVAPWASLFMRSSRQEYYSGLPFPSPGDLPNPGIKPESPALGGGFFTTEPPGKPQFEFNPNLH